MAVGIPGWITVIEEAEQELEGMLKHRFQTFTGILLNQWHRRYDWNFDVDPRNGYNYVRGRGNIQPENKVQNS